MGHPKSQWKTRKHPKRIYTGNYTRTAAGERVFILTAVLRTGKKVKEKYESHEMARRDEKFKWRNVSPHRRRKSVRKKK